MVCTYEKKLEEMVAPCSEAETHECVGLGSN